MKQGNNFVQEQYFPEDSPVCTPRVRLGAVSGAMNQNIFDSNIITVLTTNDRRHMSKRTSSLNQR